ncbi:hypothetical protein PGTUg99_013288 [Puccinia graminis f. sp. tritici]|uniref:Uncharacterized protein n=1 Tax=Puccinia graminis f. sp. tritici TaxID=56615 RepID=A0A5B0QLR4_PUCGR|nr:hypothetical protein PGTUg99_013288 [Puccinia graminis f. sp. tritici]
MLNIRHCLLAFSLVKYLSRTANARPSLWTPPDTIHDIYLAPTAFAPLAHARPALDEDERLSKAARLNPIGYGEVYHQPRTDYGATNQAHDLLAGTVPDTPHQSEPLTSRLQFNSAIWEDLDLQQLHTLISQPGDSEAFHQQESSFQGADNSHFGQQIHASGAGFENRYLNEAHMGDVNEHHYHSSLARQTFDDHEIANVSDPPPNHLDFDNSHYFNDNGYQQLLDHNRLQAHGLSASVSPSEPSMAYGHAGPSAHLADNQDDLLAPLPPQINWQPLDHPYHSPVEEPHSFHFDSYHNPSAIDSWQNDIFNELGHQSESSYHIPSQVEHHFPSEVSHHLSPEVGYSLRSEHGNPMLSEYGHPNPLELEPPFESNSGHSIPPVMSTIHDQLSPQSFPPFSADVVIPHTQTGSPLPKSPDMANLYPHYDLTHHVNAVSPHAQTFNSFESHLYNPGQHGESGHAEDLNRQTANWGSSEPSELIHMLRSIHSPSPRNDIDFRSPESLDQERHYVSPNSPSDRFVSVDQPPTDHPDHHLVNYDPHLLAQDRQKSVESSEHIKMGDIMNLKSSTIVDTLKQLGNEVERVTTMEGTTITTLGHTGLMMVHHHSETDGHLYLNWLFSSNMRLPKPKPLGLIIWRLINAICHVNLQGARAEKREDKIVMETEELMNFILAELFRPQAHYPILGRVLQLKDNPLDWFSDTQFLLLEMLSSMLSHPNPAHKDIDTVLNFKTPDIDLLSQFVYLWNSNHNPHFLQENLSVS